MSCLLGHEKFDDDHQIFYCIKKYAKVIYEGAPDHFFSLANHASAGNDAGVEGGPVTSGEEVEEIICSRALEFDVNDDNEPAPKNVLNTENDALDSNSTAASNGLYANHKQEWKSDLYVDPRRSSHG
eukprot:15344132-Ditylum_brightwellii.AAC.1